MLLLPGYFPFRENYWSRLTLKAPFTPKAEQGDPKIKNVIATIPEFSCQDECKSFDHFIKIR